MMEWATPICSRTLSHLPELRRPGPYMVKAAIIACHAEASSWTVTDWRRIVVLYDLLRFSPSPVVQLKRAVALRQAEGREVALSEVLALTRDKVIGRLAGQMTSVIFVLLK